MEIPRLYLLVLGKCYDLGPESEPKIQSEISRNHLVENHYFSLQPVFHYKMVTQMHFVVTHIGF